MLDESYAAACHEESIGLTLFTGAVTFPAMRNAKTPPKLSGAGAGKAETQRARLAAALRENLRKRKAQARERAAAMPLNPQSDKER